MMSINHGGNDHVYICRTGLSVNNHNFLNNHSFFNNHNFHLLKEPVIRQSAYHVGQVWNLAMQWADLSRLY